MAEIQMTETLQKPFGTLENSGFGDCLRLRLERNPNFGFRASTFLF
jgi:hypothetical protein